MRNIEKKYLDILVRINAQLQLQKLAMLEMARTVAVSRVFRAVVVTTMEISTVLAMSAIGGVLRSSMNRVLGVGDCTASIPI